MKNVIDEMSSDSECEQVLSNPNPTGRFQPGLPTSWRFCNSYHCLLLAAAFNLSICCRCAAPCPPILSTRSATVTSR